MADRALFVGFGIPIAGAARSAPSRLQRVHGMFGRMQSDGRIEGTTSPPRPAWRRARRLLHGPRQRGAVRRPAVRGEFAQPTIDASLIVDNFGVVPAANGVPAWAVGSAIYGEAVGKLG